MSRGLHGTRIPFINVLTYILCCFTSSRLDCSSHFQTAVIHKNLLLLPSDSIQLMLVKHIWVSYPESLSMFCNTAPNILSQQKPTQASVHQNVWEDGWIVLDEQNVWHRFFPRKEFSMKDWQRSHPNVIIFCNCLDVLNHPGFPRNHIMDQQMR